VPSRAEQKLCRPFFDQELSMVDPQLIIPIGRLAISLFYPAKEKLTQIIGTQVQSDGRWVVPLPHSSGASRWHQTEENRALIQKALGLIKAHYQGLFKNPS
jgi:uracil-DNA glycosylase